MSKQNHNSAPLEDLKKCCPVEALKTVSHFLRGAVVAGKEIVPNGSADHFASFSAASMFQLADVLDEIARGAEAQEQTPVAIRCAQAVALLRRLQELVDYRADADGDRIMSDFIQNNILNELDEFLKG